MGASLIWLLTASLLYTGCSFTVATPRNPYISKYQPSPHRYNYFDAELLEVLSRGIEGNIVISPLIVKLALEMLMDGAGGKSAEEIAAALRVPIENDVHRQEIQQRLSSIKTNVSPDTFRLASQLFISDKFHINPDYWSLLANTYGTGVSRLWFDNPRESAEIMNSWVRNATSWKITKLVEDSQVGSNTKVILANAIYFKANWNRPFLKRKTVTSCFYVQPGECMLVPMMTGSGAYEFAYVDKLDAHAVNLPYEDERVSMVIVMPKKRDGHVQLSRDMIHVSLDQIMLHMRKQDLQIEIPKFAVEYSRDIVPDLEKLHISHVFGTDANLTGISSAFNDSISVSNIFHSAKIDVDEEGTEAAASVGALLIPLMGDSTRVFKADRPFLFFIRDNLYGTILFSGKIVRPQKQQQEASVRHFFYNQPEYSSDTLNTSVFNAAKNHYSNRGVPEYPTFQHRSSFQFQSHQEWLSKVNMMRNSRLRSGYEDAISFSNSHNRMKHGRGYK